jgi:hypothetical protein
MLRVLSEAQVTQLAAKRQAVADFEVYQEVCELLQPFAPSPSVDFLGH